jgi:uncharacterized protein YecE (DUF72 family)
MIYFGCSQWGYGSWAGTLYPKDVKPGKYLYHYAQMFNSVELNPTYHDYVEQETLIRWKENVPPGFKFCPKIPKIISHDKMLYGVSEFTAEFIHRISVLEDNLGAAFLQLHKDFPPQEMMVLDDFLAMLPGDFKLSVELRPFWLEYDNTLDAALKVLKRNNAGVVIVDSLETRKYINKLKLTNHTAFIRFIAYGHETDFPRIDDWLKLIKEWQTKGLPEIYFFLHFPNDASNTEIVQYAMDKFQKLNR